MTKGECHDCHKYREWLHKHHLKPQHQGGTDADGVIYICGNCHEDRHGGPFGGPTGRGRLATTPEARAKKSKTFKRLWQDPEYRARIMEGRANGKQRDTSKIKEKLQIYWTPERREQRSSKMMELRSKRFWSTSRKWTEEERKQYLERKRPGHLR